MRGTAAPRKARRRRGPRSGSGRPNRVRRIKRRKGRVNLGRLLRDAPAVKVLPLTVLPAEEVKLQGMALPALDRRLQRRFVILVRSHMRSAQKLAHGVASLPSTASSLAATQAAWRFLNNDRISLPDLVEPLRLMAREQLERLPSRYALLVHDWCKLTYKHPARKDDLAQLTHETDVGYEMTTALLVSADDGRPLAPMEMHLKTADGMLSTRISAQQDSHVDQVLATMRASLTWNLSKPLLHVVDREADSIDHYRQWDSAGFKFLVRADDRRVRWNDNSVLLTEIYRSLRKTNAFSKVMDDATYHGKPAQLFVAETKVVLYRPAKKSVRGKKFQLPGRPVALRFIIVQVRDAKGRVLAEWFLLTNAAKLVTAEELARCYYWRWRIETYFKLLKSHGHELERWQQESGPAIARRVLVVSMACILVWQLQADTSEQATAAKDLLIKVSGRQMKRSRPHTAPALLAGLGILLPMLALLEHYDLDDIKRAASKTGCYGPGFV